MIEPKILVKGGFSPEDIHIQLNRETNRKTTQELEKLIREEWEWLYSKAKSEGRIIWDGESYRLDDFRVNEHGELFLKVSPIKYSVRAPLNRLTQYTEKLGEQYLAKGLGIGGFLKTTDGKFIFGVRSGKTLTSNKIDFIGGIVENVDLNSGKELFSQNYKEIQEEMGVSKDQIDNMVVLGMILSNTSNVIIITFTQLNIDSKKVLDVFRQRNDEEMSSLEFVEEESLKDYLHDLGGYKVVVYELLKLSNK